MKLLTLMYIFFAENTLSLFQLKGFSVYFTRVVRKICLLNYLVKGGEHIMEFTIIIIFVIWIGIESHFYYTHKRPLNDEEIRLLSNKRRYNFIQNKYSFKHSDYSPTKTFKSSLKATGALYPTAIFLSDFPSFASNLLKGKKHEWIILAFVRDEKVVYFYANKGNDNSSVSYNTSETEMIRFCKEHNCQSIMCFHNHPNGGSSNYSLLSPSKQDMVSAREISDIMIESGINWLDFVCERGKFFLYYKRFSADFYPGDSRIDIIAEQNNINEQSNYRLHREIGLFRLKKY